MSGKGILILVIGIPVMIFLGWFIKSVIYTIILITSAAQTVVNALPNVVH